MPGLKLLSQEPLWVLLLSEKGPLRLLDVGGQVWESRGSRCPLSAVHNPRLSSPSASFVLLFRREMWCSRSREAIDQSRWLYFSHTLLFPEPPALDRGLMFPKWENISISERDFRGLAWGSRGS